VDPVKVDDQVRRLVAALKVELMESNVPAALLIPFCDLSHVYDRVVCAKALTETTLKHVRRRIFRMLFRS
jgi:hypothetical protein